MRYVALLCVFLSGCLDEDFYSNGEPWVPVEDRDVPQLLKNDVLVKHPYLRRMPTNEQEWTRFIQTLNAQQVRNLGDTVQTFTPTWTGFSAAPSGDLSYMDLGELVILWTEADLQGTSNQDFMTITNLPSAIRPASTRLIHCGALRDEAATTNTLSGHVSVLSTGNMHFALDDTSTVAGLVIANPNSWTASGTKGLKSGWLVMYAR